MSNNTQFVRCDECGQLVNPDFAAKHALAHWPRNLSDVPQHAGALTRQKLLHDAQAKADAERIKRTQTDKERGA